MHKDVLLSFFMSAIVDFTTDHYVKNLLILTKQTQQPPVFFLFLDSAYFNLQNM